MVKEEKNCNTVNKTRNNKEEQTRTRTGTRRKEDNTIGKEKENKYNEGKIGGGE